MPRNVCNIVDTAGGPQQGTKVRMGTINCRPKQRPATQNNWLDTATNWLSNGCKPTASTAAPTGSAMHTAQDRTANSAERACMQGLPRAAQSAGAGGSNRDAQQQVPSRSHRRGCAAQAAAASWPSHFSGASIQQAAQGTCGEAAAQRASHVVRAAAAAGGQETKKRVRTGASCARAWHGGARISGTASQAAATERCGAASQATAT